MTLARLGFKVKVVGQRSRSNAKKSCFDITVTLIQGQGQRSESRSKVGVKVMGQGQRIRSNFWRAAVDIRGSALPSAAKSNKSHYQSEVFVCVSVINRHMRIIARMRSIGF